jgi:hypothetical protein
MLRMNGGKPMPQTATAPARRPMTRATAVIGLLFLPETRNRDLEA